MGQEYTIMTSHWNNHFRSFRVQTESMVLVGVSNIFHRCKLNMKIVPVWYGSFETNRIITLLNLTLFTGSFERKPGWSRPSFRFIAGKFVRYIMMFCVDCQPPGAKFIIASSMTGVVRRNEQVLKAKSVEVGHRRQERVDRPDGHAVFA